MRPRRIILAAHLVLVLPACAVERIDAIIAEHGVTYWPATESSTGDGSSTGTSTSTTTSSETTVGDTSSSEGASASLSAGATSSGSSDSSTGPGGPICGDNIIADDEECDDGNDQDGDACRNDCTRRWVVFVTSEPYIQGDFNGIIGADYECRHRATKMLLPNGERYMAWVSTSEVQPADRMHHARGPYVLVNGLQVAANWDALTSGTLDHAININEMGETMLATAWTGTDITGLRMPSTTHCSDWTYNDSDQTGWLADVSATDALWTRGIESDCGGFAAIYCVEQP